MFIPLIEHAEQLDLIFNNISDCHSEWSPAHKPMSGRNRGILSFQLLNKIERIRTCLTTGGFPRSKRENTVFGRNDN